MTTNKTMEERFDDAKYGWYYRDRASGFCFLREDEIKSFISQEIERAVRERGEELREKLGKEVAIHKQLANEWTGIKINGFRESINPHEEKLEVFSTILSLLQEDISNKE